jgi:hypothetical protein
MKVLIGALGANNYAKTKYKLPEPITTPYFIYAIARNERPDRVLILVTDQAKERNWDALIQEFSSDEGLPQPEAVPIPMGASPQEAQQIFRKIIEDIQENDELIVDVTSALRSIPIILLSAIRYLQYARNVTVKKIYYGAFEARKEKNAGPPPAPASETPVAEAPETPVAEAPVYEMDSFLSLLDWASAVDMFKRTGNAVLLAERLKDHESGLAIDQSTLEKLSATLEKLSRSLDLTLSQTIVVSAHQLVTRLSAVETHVETQAKDKPDSDNSDARPLTQPILDLFEGIRREFEPFAIDRPRDDVPKFLKVTFELIEWYLKRERYANALQLAREWCITWCMFRDKKPAPDLWRYKKRDEVAKKLKDDADVGGFWEDLRELRNRITHTESEEKDFDIDDPNQFDKTLAEIKDVIQKVLALRDKVAAL